MKPNQESSKKSNSPNKNTGLQINPKSKVIQKTKQQSIEK